ncbi:PAS domain-containing protein [Hymenobacter sp. BT175]|uniref:sensor histidine kinase n=1 Tax=Hymenobacter translucens TaxID=2886507 RepID=UPI001D0EACC2|nr:ATP-binding protein [Hymenobacter translucens]MCC2547310.1 PAS domain-containing protein [Hymenobacter translucens]
MSLRAKFLLFVTIIHGVLIGLAAQLRLTNPTLFVVSEVFLLISIFLTVQLYQGFVRPFHLIAAGTEAIRTKDFSMKFVPVGQREMDQLIDVYNHMIDALRQERVTQHEKSYLLERLIQASPAGILLLNFDGAIEAVNPAAERCLHLSAAELLGQHPGELPGDWGPALQSLRAGDPQVIRLSGIQTYRAHCSHFVDRGFTRNFIVLEELTQDLIRQEKLAYEKLIRMMSHEINNSIGAINSILQSFSYYTTQLDPADQPDFTEALEVSINRNTHLANFIANFANLVRLPAPRLAPHNVHDLLRAIHRLMLVQTERRHISWHWHLADEPLWVELDSQQIEQALLNIVKNAIEAIGEDGNLSVHTSLDPPMLRIENDGPGIPSDVQRRLFTPFFTTKRDGQGIGLTMIRDILLQHGFPFSLETTPGGTTAFTVWLTPTTAGQAAVRQSAAEVS